MCIVVGFEFASCSAINSLGDLEHIASKLSHFTVLSPNEVPLVEGSLNEISAGSWELTWLCAVVAERGCISPSGDTMRSVVLHWS